MRRPRSPPCGRRCGRGTGRSAPGSRRTASIAAAIAAGGSSAWDSRSAISARIASAPASWASSRRRSPIPWVAGLAITSTSSPSRTARQSRITALTARSRSLIGRSLEAVSATNYVPLRPSSGHPGHRRGSCRCPPLRIGSALVGRGARHLAGTVAAALSRRAGDPGLGRGLRRASPTVSRRARSRPTRRSSGLAPSSRGPVRAERHQPSLRRVTRRGSSSTGLRARSATTSTVQVKIRHLEPNETLQLPLLRRRPSAPLQRDGQLRDGARAHPRPKTIRFAYSGDETGVSAPGEHEAVLGPTSRRSSRWPREHNDFNIDFGDTIYSDPEVPGRRDRPAR